MGFFLSLVRLDLSELPLFECYLRIVKKFLKGLIMDEELDFLMTCTPRLRKLLYFDHNYRKEL